MKPILIGAAAVLGAVVGSTSWRKVGENKGRSGRLQGRMIIRPYAKEEWVQ